MSYNSQIPQPGDIISASQGQLLANFDQLNQKWAVNHYGLDPATANDGKHKFVTLPEQSAAPTTGADEVAIYSKDVGGSTQVFVRYPNDGSEISIVGSSLLQVQDQKASGTNGGTFTSGAWQTRELNTVVTNGISGASLASNAITLPAGSYYVEATGIAWRVGVNRVRLQNTTGSATLLTGLSEFAGITESGSETTSAAQVTGNFSLSVTSTVELQHRCGNTYANRGFGDPSSFGTNELYADVRIWRVG
jgi:hypothetical protein